MTYLEVGKPYPAALPKIEGAQYNFRGGAHELLLLFPSPSHREIDAVRRRTAEFALVLHRDVIFLLYRFADGVPWSDAAYSFHLVKEAEREMPQAPSISTDFRALLTIILVDSATNLVCAIRALSFSPEFTRHLHEAIAFQAQHPIPADYDRQIREAYTLWPSTEKMLAAASVRCMGGA